VIPGGYTLAITGKEQRKWGCFKRRNGHWIPKQQWKKNMPSNYAKEIRAGLYRLLSPFQLELTS
jgi:hypothetical protein